MIRSARTMSARMGAVLIAVLATASCGSSGGSGGKTTQSAPSGPAGSDQSVTVDTNFSGEGSSELCSYAQEVEQSGALNPDELSKEKFDQLQDSLEKAEAKAPPEIKGDLDKLLEAITKLRPIYEKYHFDESEIAASFTSDPDIQAVFATLDDPEFEAAGRRVDAYFEQICGLAPSTS